MFPHHSVRSDDPLHILEKSCPEAEVLGGQDSDIAGGGYGKHQVREVHQPLLVEGHLLRGESLGCERLD